MKDLMPLLHANDEIRIVSTARKISADELKDAFDFIRSKGFKPTLGKNIYQADHQFAGNDNARLEDLQTAIDDPNVKAIWMARGGYGTQRIIDDVSFKSLEKSPKWIIGYSDVTVLHSALNKNNIESLHATMPINFKDQSLESFNGLISILEGEKPNYSIESHPLNIKGKAKGKLVGGNLSIIYSLTGTSILPEMKGSILFLEDLDEYLYHVDRMMMNLKLSGVLDDISGLIIGGMSDMNDNKVPFGKNALEIIDEHVSDLGIPVCYQFPAGHQFENLPLILGREVSLEVRDKVLISY